MSNYTVCVKLHTMCTISQLSEMTLLIAAPFNLNLTLTRLISAMVGANNSITFTCQDALWVKVREEEELFVSDQVERAINSLSFLPGQVVG